jgi:hypothetical protein
MGESLRSSYPGPLYPWRETRFERPFIVLGGLLEDTLRASAIDVSNLTAAADAFGVTRYYLDLTGKGYDFDLDGDWNTTVGGVLQNDVAAVSMKLLRSARTFYGMLTGEGRDHTGASSEVYLLTYGDPTGRNNNGAFRVIGAGTVGYTGHEAPNAGSLVLEPLSGDFTAWSATGSGNDITADFRSQWHNADDVSAYVSRTADLVVVLTDIAGEADEGLPWDTADLPAALQLGTDGGFYYAPSKMVLSTTLLYHPGRSATARVPDDFVRFAMRGGSEETLGTYLRRAPSSIDTTFSAIGTATDETYWPSVHIQTWNRLSGLGWHAPEAPAYGGDVVGFTEQDREHECFTDRGSKTVLFRPYRNRDMTLNAVTWGVGELAVGDCLLGDYLYPDATEKDPIDILTGGAGDAGKRMGYKVPREFMPRFGRQDIPYRQLNAGATPTSAGFMPGINHLFTDVTDVTNPVFNLIGGERNAGGSEVNSLFLVTRATQIAYAHAQPSYGPKNIGAYGARKTTDLLPAAGQDTRDVIAALAAVNSSDLGRGLKGIQMPPYMGIARLYGVYEYEDYVEKGGTAFKSNRYEMEANPAINLLREDVDQQTLFILQDGAKDLTTETGDHTYVIPSNVLDLTRIPADPGNAHQGYVEGVSLFEDFDYVVECTVFFFAKGFINGNNLVLPRDRNGSYGQNVDGVETELENVPMCIPAPAGVNDRLYTAYNRTVYQGDPFMTRDGDTRQEADYENRYGRLTVSQANLLRTAVQQFDSAGDFMPEMSNPRAFEILASMDFYTTLGTGKIGGELFAGTPLDVGHIGSSDLTATRMPLTSTSKDWRIDVRAFTEGQKENQSRARALLSVLDNDSMINAVSNDDTFQVQFTLLDDSVVTLYGSTAAFIATLTGAPNNIPAQDIFTLDETSSVREYTALNQALDFGLIDDGNFGFDTIAIPGVALGDSVEVNLVSGSLDLNYFGLVSAPNTVMVVVQNLSPDIPYSSLSDNDSIKIVTATAVAVGVIAPFTSNVVSLAFLGAAVGDAVVANPVSPVDPGVVITADTVTVPGNVNIRFHNYSPAPIVAGTDVDFHVAVLKEHPLGHVDMTVGNSTLNVRVRQTAGTETGTAAALVATINAHGQLGRTVTAFADAAKITLEAIPTGAEGNGIKVATGKTSWGSTAGTAPAQLQDTLRLEVPFNNELPVGHNTTATFLYGGVDLPVNAGNGTSQMALTGMTERLPLGVLVQDNDFLCENPLDDTASAMNSAPAPLRPIQTLMPLTGGGEEFSRFLGAPGELVALADGQIAPQSWTAWTEAAPDGATKKFRLYRGGGSAFVLSGDNPGGPLDWVSESFPKSSQPVLKGGVLACRAMLVRNYYEEAFSGGSLAAPSQGDEVQLLVVTYAHLGNGNTVEEGVTLDGIISPTGYGEGYSAADRYRCMGRPMVRGYSRVVPDPAAVTLAVYPEDQRGS